MNPTISIIIPVYDAAAHLRPCVESVLNQTFPDFELILINDGSKDNSGEICQEYANIDARIVYIEKPNTGVSNTRNRGLELAKGKYLTFSDSDDWLDPNSFETCLNALERTGADMVKFGYTRDYVNGTIEPHSIEQETLYTEKWRMMKHSDEIEYHAFVWNMMVKRSLVEDIRFDEDINWLEDQAYGYRCMFRCNNFLFIPDRLYHYNHWDTGSLSNVKDPYVVSKAIWLEHALKSKLNDTGNQDYQNYVDDDYRYRLDFLAWVLYLARNISYSERKKIVEKQEILYPLFYKEGRILYNKCIPFIVRDCIVGLIVKLKSIKNKEIARV